MLPAPLDLEVYSVSNRNKYQKQKKKKFLGSRARPERKDDNLIALC
jgi:hypothetical protein